MAMFIQYLGNNSTTIKYTPGSQEIVVSGTGSAWARIDYEGTDTPAWPTYEK